MMGFVMDDRKVEEKWKFCARSPISLSLHEILPLFLVMTSFVIVELLNLHI